MSLVWQVAYLIVYFFFLFLLARLVFEWVQSFARRWRPSRPAAVTLELVFSVTDPPLNLLRRVIPPLRVGGISLDLGFILLLVIVYVLMSLLGGLSFR
ncbi:YggT family protein [Fodinicola acaciae]|uniref:YggT family protein n=1 Tax=Fodinicola acaciae TaxID=2681555 RepID=UPI0013D178B2|nr:YggT family protein [Fodinicola acaciae]